MRMKQEINNARHAGMRAGAAALLAVFLCAPPDARAAGTAAGTDIVNQATVACTIDGAQYTATSSAATIRVQEIIASSLVGLDAAPGVSADPGQADRVAAFRLTNVGNGGETFALAAQSAGLGGDQFDPVLTGISLDANGNNLYDAGVDAAYAPGSNDPVLARDASLTVFVLNNIPPSGVNDGDRGITRLAAVPKTGTGPAGTVFTGQGDGGTDAMLGPAGGMAAATAAYVVSSVAVAVSKTLAVIDQFGGSEPITGATLRYTITVTASGSGTASGVVIGDPVPADTVYRAGTLSLNGQALTDAADGDAGDVNATTAGTVTVSLGNLTSASPAQTIRFDVKIR